jgi:16S rRNA (cytosine967-C5)-methyltransferase
MKISPARIAAYECLIGIERDRIFSSTLLPKYEETLSPVDRSLCHELVLGVLRRQIFLDAHIDALVGKKRLDPEIRQILRLGVFQIMFLERVPSHAIVNDSVNLVVRSKKTSAKGLVNAVLRKAANGLPALTFPNDIERISIETSHPEWLIERWIRQFGIDETERLALADNQTPPLTFRATIRGRELVFEGRYKRSEFLPDCFFAEAFNEEMKTLADEGSIYFQDEGSQIVAAAAIADHRGGGFFDVCASPGGKTTAVAKLINRDRTLLVAGDISDRRVRLLKETCLKQDAGFVNIVQYDGSRALPFADQTFDTVLVDAPCTGTGTIRHNPEIRYFLDADDLGKMHVLQLAILQNSALAVNHGGRLIYSTCSLETEENEGVCRDFLASTSDFHPIEPTVPSGFLTADGFARTWPHRDGMDGFFIATFTRR